MYCSTNYRTNVASGHAKRASGNIVIKATQWSGRWYCSIAFLLAMSCTATACQKRTWVFWGYATAGKKGQKHAKMRPSKYKQNDCVAQGAAFAKNCGASLRPAKQEPCELYFFCLLDSEDNMHKTRVAEQQVHHVLVALPKNDRQNTILAVRLILILWQHLALCWVG
jgi:hypothetical protein